MDCRDSLKPAVSTFPKSKHYYLDSTAKFTVSSDTTNFFTSNDPNGDCPAPTWTLKKSDGSTYTSGKLSINSSTGKLEAKQNIEPGYTETV